MATKEVTKKPSNEENVKNVEKEEFSLVEPQFTPDMIKKIFVGNVEYIKKYHIKNINNAKTDEDLIKAVCHLNDLTTSMKAMCFYLKQKK